MEVAWRASDEKGDEDDGQDDDTAPEEEPLTEEQLQQAENAYMLLTSFDRLPGTDRDGRVDPAAHRCQRARRKHRTVAFAHVRGRMEVQAGAYCKTARFAVWRPSAVVKMSVSMRKPGDLGADGGLHPGCGGDRSYRVLDTQRRTGHRAGQPGPLYRAQCQRATSASVVS